MAREEESSRVATNRCPSCGSSAEPEAAGDLGYRCAVCGTPRIVVDDPEVERSGREAPLLERAQKLRLQRAMWGIAAGVVGAFGIVSLIVVLGVLVLASAGTFASVLSLVAAALPIGLALLLWGRVRRITEEMKGSVADAWRIVTEDVVNTKGAEVTAADVAKSMRIGEARADALLSELSAHDVLRARVTDEGELAFSTRGAPRLRIEDTESEALAETEAEAAENAARRPRTSEKESD